MSELLAAEVELDACNAATAFAFAFAVSSFSEGVIRFALPLAIDEDSGRCLADVSVEYISKNLVNITQFTFHTGMRELTVHIAI